MLIALASRLSRKIRRRRAAHAEGVTLIGISDGETAFLFVDRALLENSRLADV